MTEIAKKYLVDVLQAIELIYAFKEGIERFDQYQSDLKSQSAIERQLGIVGEAINQFEKQETGVPLNHSKKIIGFRNRLIHAYDRIDHTIVWAILQTHLPQLKEEVEDTLGK